MQVTGTLKGLITREYTFFSNLLPQPKLCPDPAIDGTQKMYSGMALVRGSSGCNRIRRLYEPGQLAAVVNLWRPASLCE